MLSLSSQIVLIFFHFSQFSFLSFFFNHLIITSVCLSLGIFHFWFLFFFLLFFFLLHLNFDWRLYWLSLLRTWTSYWTFVSFTNDWFFLQEIFFDFFFFLNFCEKHFLVFVNNWDYFSKFLNTKIVFWRFWFWSIWRVSITCLYQFYILLQLLRKHIKHSTTLVFRVKLFDFWRNKQVFIY